MKSDQTAISLQVIDLWRTLEALSPCAPPREDREQHVWSAESALRFPWHEQLRAEYSGAGDEQWQFLLYIGIFSMEDVLESLAQILQMPRIRGGNGEREEVALACLVVDIHGRVIGDPSVSSVPWALQELAAGRSFRHWPSTEVELKESINRYLSDRKLLRTTEEPSDVRTPFSPEDALAIVHIIHKSAGWFPRSKLKHTMRFRGELLKIRKDKTFPDLEPELFNSPYLSDLERVAASIQQGSVGPGLERYLLGAPQSERIDVRDEHQVVGLISPSLLTPARWPTTGDTHLDLSQQTALSGCLTTLKDSGLFSISGPRGSGKTTVLRDLIAAVIVERAKALSRLEDPEEGFSYRTRLNGRGTSHWLLSEQLRGFEIVVTSNTDLQAEEIAREIPGVDTVDERWVNEVDHFQDIADLLAAPEKDLDESGSSWALLGALLGRPACGDAFITRFWFGKRRDDESYHPCFRHLLAAGEISNWQEARASFLKSLDDFQSRRGRLCEIERTVEDLRARRGEVEGAEAALLEQKQFGVSLREKRRVLEKHKERLQARVEVLTRIVDHATQIERIRGELATHSDEITRYASGLAAATRELNLSLTEREVLLESIRNISAYFPSHKRKKPSLFTRLISFAPMKRWRGEHERLSAELSRQQEELRKTDEQLLQHEARIRSFEEALAAIQSNSEELQANEQEHLGRLSALTHGELANLVRALLEIKSFSHAFERLKERAAKAVTLYREVRREIECLTEEIDELKAVIKRKEEKLRESYSSLTSLMSHLHTVKEAHGVTLPDEEWHALPYTSRELSSPWMDSHLHDARVRCFLSALALHRSFIINNSERVRAGLAAWTDIVSGKVKGSAEDDISGLWSLFSIAVPVISTTSAYFDKLFRDVRAEELGWVIVNEAGQASPQAAIGALWRAKRGLTIGDQRDLLPGYRLPARALQALRHRFEVSDDWDPSLVSAQTLGDRGNRIGTFIEASNSALWVGAPLRVQRGFTDPMYSLSNAIAYGGLITLSRREGDFTTSLGESRWFHIKGETRRGDFVYEEASRARELLEVLTRESFEKSAALPKVFILSPFRTVIEGLKEMLVPDYDQRWISSISGTLNTFHERSADIVILLLGGDPLNADGRDWVSALPNYLNVALSRAKERLYVIGNREVWERHPYFSELSAVLADHVAMKVA